MANSHGLTSRIVKKQAAARKLAKNKKAAYQVYIWNENPQTRKNQSYKARTHYFENKKNFPKKKLANKNPSALMEQGIIDERGFFVKGKKKNFLTKTMVDEKGLDFYGMPR
jgi:carbamoylphosphate synthase large subunit